MALLALCTLVLAACGDDEDGTIPDEPAQSLQAQLDQIEASVGAGECDAAQTQAVGFAQSVNELPDDVDSRVREKLVEAAGNLAALTGTQCEEPDTGTTGELPAPLPPVDPEPETPDEEPEAEPEDEDKGKDKEKDTGPPADKPGNSDPGGDGEGSSGGIGSD